jgi:hypothetical protein
MKQIKIFRDFVDHTGKLEREVNDWIFANTIAVVDIKQTTCTGRYDFIVITVLYDADEPLQKEKVKQTDSYDRYYFQDAANEYMSR